MCAHFFMFNNRKVLLECITKFDSTKTVWGNMPLNHAWYYQLSLRKKKGGLFFKKLSLGLYW